MRVYEEFIFGTGDDCPCVSVHVRSDGGVTVWEWSNVRECVLGMFDAYGLKPSEYHVHYVDIPLFAIRQD